MLLEQPSVFSDDARRGLELWRHGVVAGDSFAEPGNSEQIVAHGAARLAEVVRDPRFCFLRRIRRKEWPHANSQLVLTPEFERVLLILNVARIDHTGKPKAVGMGIQLGGSAQSVFGRLRRLKRSDGGIRRRDYSALLIDVHTFGCEECPAQAVRDRASAGARAGNVDSVL